MPRPDKPEKLDKGTRTERMKGVVVCNCGRRGPFKTWKGVHV